MENCTISVESKEIVIFFYPNYVCRDVIDSSCQNLDIIYTGKYYPTLRDDLKIYTRNFISLAGVPDKDLSTHKALLNWVIEKKKYRIAKRFIEQADDYDYNYFYYLLKILWLTGKWVDKSQGDESIYDLYESFSLSLKDLILTGFKITDNLPYSMVESSLFTFLERVNDWENQTVNPQYKRLLKTVNLRIGNNIKKSTLSYIKRKGIKSDLKLLSFLLDLRVKS